MQALDPAGNYTDAEVIDVLTAQRGGRRMTYRYDRLDDLNRYVGPVDWVIGGKLANNALADIKRTATFTILDRGGINYLKDRIMPFARLDMPTTYVDVPPTFTEWAETGRNLLLNPAPAPTTATPSQWLLNRPTNGKLDVPATPGEVRYQATAASGLTEGVSARAGASEFAVGEFVAARIEVKAEGTLIGRSATAIYYTTTTVASVAFTYTGEWQTLDIPATLAVPAVAGGGIYVYVPGQLATDVLRLRNARADRVAAIGDKLDRFFTGSTRPDGTLVRTRWEAGVGSSESIEEARTIDVPGHREPDGRPGFVEWPLGVFLLATPARTLGETGVVQREVQAFDQLLVLMQDKVADRYSVNAGVKYTDAIDTLTFGLNRAITPSSVTLSTAREWEPGTSKLRILNDLLAAINYESAWFDELGRLICRPYLSPADRTSEYTFADGQWSVRTGDAEQVLDLFDVPNRWVLVKSEADEAPLTSIYTNDDPSSPTSTVSRGRIIVDFRDNEDAADQASLDAKAARYAFEASQIYERMTINTAVMPMCSNADVVTLGLPDLAVDAKYTGHTWEYDMRAGAVMKHTVRRVVAV